jgi:2-oxoglutarate dehydrogenase E2 component (dihydrolipoamide succinyltransferase)
MPLVDLVMPKLGESIMEATILKWYKQVGDTINLDETLLDIATDKVDSEVPSTSAGVIKEILFEVNAVVPIGAVIARVETNVSSSTPTSATNTSSPKEVFNPIVTNKVDRVQPTPQVVAETMEEVPFTPNSSVAPAPIPVIENTSNGEAKFYSPLVLNIAQNEGVSFNELQNIQGTGSQGRVSKKDILNYVAAKKAGTLTPVSTNIVSSPNVPTQPTVPVLPTQTSTPSKSLDELLVNQSNFMSHSGSAKIANPEDVIISGNTEIVEMDRMRKLIAKHMVDSVQTSPHVTSFVEADVTNMVVWREKVKQLFEKREGTKLTFTPMFFECIAAALEQYPIVNSSLQNDQIIYRKDINIGMATALPTGNLIVPVIKGANQLSIVGLSKAVNGLANAARNNQLRPQDTQGGTFTVTNVGTFGSIMGTPIINQPQVAVLALGAIKKRAVVVDSPLGDAIAIRHMMYLSMSYDHRIVDGAVGSQFLTAVAKAFESWDPNRQWFQYV